MAKVDYNYPIEALHGKVSRKHTVSFNQRKATGTKYTTIVERVQTTATAEQAEIRTKFANAVKATYTRMADSTKALEDKAAFLKQSKYKTLYGYVFSLVYNS